VRRLSPITIGLLALAAVVAAIALYVLLRSPSVPEPAPPPPEPDEAPTRQERRPPAASAPAHPRELPPMSTPSAPPAQPQPPDVAAPVVAAAIAPAPSRDAGQSINRGRGLLVAQLFHKRRLEADERAFESLKMGEATRTSIRQINDAYKKQIDEAWTGSGVDGAPADPPGAPSNAAATRARHEALVNLLGADASREFEAAERAAIQQVRGKYRVEGARLLRLQAAPGTPEGQLPP
jgi:hypothetical protein